MANQKVIDKLRELENDGRLLPSNVVEEARDENSPLHEFFEWEDTIAAEKYRLSQARTLIRSVKISVTVHTIPLTVVSYVRDPELQTKDAGYRNVLSLRSEEDNARAAIVEEMKRVSNAVRRAKSIAAVLGFVDEIERIEALASAVSERATAASPPVGPAQ